MTDGETRVWLDDLRKPPSDDWIWVKTIEVAVSRLQEGIVAELSLDNDLGEGIPEGRKLVLWMAENDIWPSKAIAIHSANPVAVDYMTSMIDRYGPFKRNLGTRRFER